MAKTIVIYQDEGVGKFGFSCLKSFFKNDGVRLADANAVIDNSAFGGADIFVMPGGADLPYCKKLNGAGNRNIRAFVEGGGTYLGICAGAYYACTSIEYHKGRNDEICGPRELALINAVGIGSLPELAPYYDDRLHTATVANLTLADGTTAPTLYFGGCRFDLKEKADILARYDFGNKPAAIIGKNVGKGRVILSGVHAEVSAEDMKSYPLEEGDNPVKREDIAAGLQNSRRFLQNLLNQEERV